MERSPREVIPGARRVAGLCGARTLRSVGDRKAAIHAVDVQRLNPHLRELQAMSDRGFLCLGWGHGQKGCHDPPMSGALILTVSNEPAFVSYA